MWICYGYFCLSCLKHDMGMGECFIRKVKLMFSNVKTTLNVNLENIIKIPSPKRSEVTITPNIVSIFVGWGDHSTFSLHRHLIREKIWGLLVAKGYCPRNNLPICWWCAHISIQVHEKRSIFNLVKNTIVPGWFWQFF